MSARETPFETHSVFNQSPRFDEISLYAGDRAVRANLETEGDSAHQDDLLGFGAELGRSSLFGQACLANTPSTNRKAQQDLQAGDELGARLRESHRCVGL